MFQSTVWGAPRGRSSEWLWGTGLSSLVYGALALAAALVAQGRPEEDKPSIPDVVFRQFPQRASGENRGLGARAAPAAASPRPAQKRQAQKLPSKVRPTASLSPAPTTADEAPAEEMQLEGGSSGGEEQGGESTGPCCTDEMAHGEEVVPFGEGMVAPRLLSGDEIRFSREALSAGVEGTVIARCTITREGTVRDCHVLKGVPFMSEVVVAALLSRSYQPVRFQGQSVSVNYVFNVRLERR